MKNLELALAFERIAALLEFLGDSPYKIRAYRRAARTLLELAEPVEQLAEQGRLRQLPGIGEALAAKVEEFLRTGSIAALVRLEQQVPQGVLELAQLPGVGPRTARLLYDALGVRSVEELEQAARQGRVRTVKGMGPRSEQALLEAIERWRASAGRWSLAYLWLAAEGMLGFLRGRPGIGRVEVAGSLRRAEEMGADVDLVVEALEPQQALRHLEPVGAPQEGPWAGTWRVRGRGPTGLPVDAWVVPPPLWAAALWEATGPPAHREGLLERLKRRGLRLVAGRLMDPQGQALELASEETLYRMAGVGWVAPELRWGEDELALAERGGLPGRLVELDDIRGDLHVHTDASDGTASAREMVAAARARGLEYLAITDHSPSLTVARGLTVERLQAHLQEVAALDGPQLRVLGGAEVDVLPGGQLDYPDDVLASLGVVVASVHTQLRQERAAMTQRLVAACDHRLVHILGHPTGRLLGRRAPYDVDLEAVLDRAAQTDTIVEINASPDRLDLSARWAREARRRGVRLVIDTDAHSPAQLGFMRYGMLVARRAGLGPEDVLNTLPKEQLLEQLALKRRRRG